MTDINNIWTLFVEAQKRFAKRWYKGTYILFIIVCIMLLFYYTVLYKISQSDILVSDLILVLWLFWMGAAYGAYILAYEYKKEVIHAKKKD